MPVASYKWAWWAAVLALPLLLPAALWAASLEVSWDPNTEPDLAGYAIFYGTAPGDYGRPVMVSATALQPSGGRLHYVLSGLEPYTTYFVALKAYDTSGNLSGFSNEDYVTTGANLVQMGAAGGGGCFIATAAYGTPAARQVRALRRFRDTVLLRGSLGRALVSHYARLSPALAAFVRQHPWLRAALRPVLQPLVVLAGGAPLHSPPAP